MNNDRKDNPQTKAPQSSQFRPMGRGGPAAMMKGEKTARF